MKACAISARQKAARKATARSMMAGSMATLRPDRCKGIVAERADGSKSRLHRRIDAARSLASDLADDGHARMAQVIRDVCNSAMDSSTTNSQLSTDNKCLSATNAALLRELESFRRAAMLCLERWR